MMRINIIVAGIALCLTACGPSPDEIAAQKALNPLHKMQAATQVGTTLLAYRELLINAQAEVNDATRNLPPSRLMRWLPLSAMKCYTDAVLMWELAARPRKYFDMPDDADGTFIVHGYGGFAKDHESRMPPPYSGGIAYSGAQADPREGMQRAWIFANGDINAIEKLLSDRDFRDTTNGDPRCAIPY